MNPAVRLTSIRLRRLAEELPARYTAVLPHLERARVLTGNQLDRLLAEAEVDSHTTARVRRRIMNRLCDLGLADTLERRIGGVRAGSAGHIYTLTSAGHKLLALINGAQPPQRARHSHNPGTLFLAHALAISEIYASLIRASRAGGFRVAVFVTEPHSWWPQGDGTFLRPDAYTLLATTGYSDAWWIEVDLATETLPRLRRKLHTYLDFAHRGGIGPDSVLPHVLLTAPNRQRHAAIEALITGLPPPSEQLFYTVPHEGAVHHLTDTLTEQ